jgi:hypothetical protein
MNLGKRLILFLMAPALFLILLESTLFLITYLKYSSPEVDLTGSEKIILAYGESTTQMGGEHSWPSQLESKLNKGTDQNRFKVINRGGVGVSTVTILNKIKEDLKSIKPTIVITMMGINEENLTSEYELLKDDHKVPLLGSLRSYRLISWAWYRIKVFLTLNFLEDEEKLSELWESSELEIVIDYLKKKMNSSTCQGERYGLKLVGHYIELKELKKAFSILKKRDVCPENSFQKSFLHASALIYEYSENNAIEQIFDNAFLRPPEYLGKKEIVEKESLEQHINFFKRIYSSYLVNGIEWRLFKRGSYPDIEETELSFLLAVLFLEKKDFKEAGKYLENALLKIKDKKKDGWIDDPGFIYLLLSDIEKITGGKNYNSYYTKASQSLLIKEIIRKREKYDGYNLVTTGFIQEPLLKAKKLLNELRKRNNSLEDKADILNVLSEVEFILGNDKESLAVLKELKRLSLPRVNLILLPRLLDILGDPEQALVEIRNISSTISIDKEPFLREELFILQKLRRPSVEIERVSDLLKKSEGIKDNDKSILNYKKANDLIHESGAYHLVMQYPLRSIEELRESLAGRDKTIFVENEENFKKLVLAKGYDYLFIDRFASDFGHCTKQGNELIAENVKNHVKILLNLKN